MAIKQSIENDLKAALLAGDKTKASTLRVIKSAILNAEIEQNKRDTGLDEPTLIAVLAKEAKSRQDSADLYLKGGAQERADNELAEKAIIESYLPAQMSDEELMGLIEEAITATGASGMADMGKVIGMVKAQSAGQADGGRIAAAVKDKLA